jgi:ankyrin repeat protein
MTSDCEVLGDELLKLSNKRILELNKNETNDNWEKEAEEKEWNSYLAKRLVLRSKRAPELLSFEMGDQISRIRTFRALLAKEDERGIEEFQRLGADMILPADYHETTSCLELMTKWGYALFLEQVGARLFSNNPAWVNEMEESPTKRESLLYIACERKLPNLEVVKVLVEKFGVNVNAVSHNRFSHFTVLHLLAQCQNWWNLGALEYLLEHGANSEIRTEDFGCTPLHIAVRNNRAAAVEILLRHGADPNTLDNSGTSCLNKAAGNFEISRDLINHSADVSIGKEPLIFDAIEAMNLGLVQLLAKLGTDFNARLPPEKTSTRTAGRNKFASRTGGMASLNSSGEPEFSYPIHYCASAKFNTPESRLQMIPIIECLLNSGADPFLHFNDEGDSILHDLCRRRGILEPFLDLPTIDLEARDSQGRTLLLSACSIHPGRCLSSEDLRDQRLLLSKGANLAAVDNKGRNVLHCFVASCDRHKWEQVSEPSDFAYFLSKPSGRTLAIQKDKEGATPLHDALRNCQLWAVEPLLSHGANPIEQDIEGNTALHHLAPLLRYPYNSASATQSLLLFKKFLDLGVDINTRNYAGETALFNGLCSSWFDDMPLFLDAGGDLTVRSKKGQGLLHIVARNGKAETFKWLMEKGLDPLAEDGEQRSAVDVAHASKNKEILDIFRREV